MGTAVNTLIAAIRVLIPEADAVDWQNVDLLSYLQIEYDEWSARLGRLPGPGWFTISVTFTLPANATTFDLTTLISSSVGYFAALKSCYYVPVSGCETPIDTASPGQESQWRNPVGTNPTGQQAPDRKWITRPAGVPTLNLQPPANVDRTIRADIRYQPPTLALGGNVQTDPRHDDVLVKGAALRALLNVGETDPVIKQEYELAKIRFVDDESNVGGENESTTTKVVVSDEWFGS